MEFEAFVIGTGFGAMIAVIRLATLGENTMRIERETWWITAEALGSPALPKPPKKPSAKYLKRRSKNGRQRKFVARVPRCIRQLSERPGRRVSQPHGPES